MIRILIVLLLTVAAALAQAAPGQGSNRPVTAAKPGPVAAAPAELPPDAVVITVRGVCGAKSESAAPCVTTIARDQFDTIVSAMTLSNPGQALTAAAMRNFAESYVQSLILADAAEKAGVDQDPRFRELMNLMRLRTLADVYRHLLQEKYGNPSPQEVEAEYKRDSDKFEQVALERIFIPKFNPKSPRENRAEFEKKAQQVAAQVRERAVKGEDMNKLQVEACKSLGVMPPLTTDVGPRRTAGLPAALQQQISALKTGEVSKVGSESAGFTIYKVRSREVLPLEQVKAEIVRAIYQKKMDDELEAVQSRVHAEFEPRYFGPQGPPRALPPAKPAQVP